jgi:thiamine biosynthesis protein ThiI
MDSIRRPAPKRLFSAAAVLFLVMDELTTETDHQSEGAKPGPPPAAGRMGEIERESASGPRTVRALVRFSGELATKSRRTRARFQKRLVVNLRDALASEGTEAQVEGGWSRLYLEGPSDAFLDPLGRTFGVSSSSLVIGECAARLDEIIETGVRLYGEQVRGRRFAVRARRAGDHAFHSSDIHRDLGAALNPGATVDLDDPEVTVRVEVRDDRAHFYEDPVAGAAGLPLGVQGTAVALISGGFDSAVAAWMALRRGISLDYVFCNLGGAAYKRMVVEVSKVLADRWSYGTHPRLHVLEFEPIVAAMRERAKPAYLQVVLKRLMYRAASTIAEEIGAEAIITGESVGQVSSQTLVNLRAIDDASERPVLRPLLGFHKEEILVRAREIGTHDLSARVREYCDVAPDRPVTAASPESAREQEDSVGVVELEQAIAAREVLKLRSLRVSEVVGANLYVSEMPTGARVIDTRHMEAYQAWHWPVAEHREFEDLERRYRGLDREQTYVLICAEGIRTAFLAERMQADGFEAYSFLGGAPRLRKLAGTSV